MTVRDRLMSGLHDMEGRYRGMRDADFVNLATIVEFRDAAANEEVWCVKELDSLTPELRQPARRYVQLMADLASRLNELALAADRVEPGDAFPPSRLQEDITAVVEDGFPRLREAIDQASAGGY